MTTWATDARRTIAEADDLHIAPFRADEVTHGTPTWMWSVAVGDALDVRAYNGKNSRSDQLKADANMTLQRESRRASRRADRRRRQRHRRGLRGYAGAGRPGDRRAAREARRWGQSGNEFGGRARQVAPASHADSVEA